MGPIGIRESSRCCERRRRDGSGDVRLCLFEEWVGFTFGEIDRLRDLIRTERP